MRDLQLSFHFNTREFACPCCGEWVTSSRLVQALEDLRQKLGYPIIITSGYRCERHNVEVNGERHSQHLLGLAVDVQTEYHEPCAIAAYAREIPAFKGIGIYEYHVHLDVRDGARVEW